MPINHNQPKRPRIGARVTYIDNVLAYEGKVIGHSDLNTAIVELDAPYVARYGKIKTVYGYDLQFLNEDK